MCEELKDEDLGELKTLVTTNAEAILKLRLMVENLEILLAKLSEAKQSERPVKGNAEGEQ